MQMNVESLAAKRKKRVSPRMAVSYPVCIVLESYAVEDGFALLILFPPVRGLQVCVTTLGVVLRTRAFHLHP